MALFPCSAKSTLTSSHTPGQDTLPNLLVVGAAKCGTTTLHALLSQHPEIFACSPKEPKFFSFNAGHTSYSGPLDDKVKQGCIKNFTAYNDLFSTGRDHAYRCESSADNLYYHRDVIPEIRTRLGDPKIIIALRDPVARVNSAYNHLVQEGRETYPLGKALREEGARIANGYEFLWHYRAASTYFDAVLDYKINFSNVHTVLLEELDSNFEHELQRLGTFLDLDLNHLRAIVENKNAPVRSLGFKRILDSDSKLFTAMRTARPQSIKGLFYQRLVQLNQAQDTSQNIRNAKTLSHDFKQDVSQLSNLLGIRLHDKWLARYE